MELKSNVKSKQENSITKENKEMVASNFSLNSISTLSTAELFDLPNEGIIEFQCTYLLLKMKY